MWCKSMPASSVLETDKHSTLVKLQETFTPGGESTQEIMKGENQNHSKGDTNRRNIVGLSQILRQMWCIASKTVFQDKLLRECAKGDAGLNS